VLCFVERDLWLIISLAAAEDRAEDPFGRAASRFRRGVCRDHTHTFPPASLTMDQLFASMVVGWREEGRTPTEGRGGTNTN
jgi:hypothetical protein